MEWKEALEINNGDFAYAPDGGGINREGNGITYTVMNGNLKSACAGDWNKVERTGLTEEQIPQALKELNIPATDWSYE